MNYLSKLIKKLSWQDYLVFCFIIFFLAMQINLMSDYEQLPAPLYGGDLYLQLGAVNHVKYGGNPLTNFRNSDPIPNYLPLYTAIVGGSARIFNLDSITSTYIFSCLFIILGILIVYNLGKLLFKDKTIAVFTPFIYFFPILCSNAFRFYFIAKYTYFAIAVIFPLFFLCLFKSLSEKKAKKKWLYSAITGVVYGLASISHGTLFPSLTLFLGLVFLYLFIFKHVKFKDKKIKFRNKEWMKNLKTNFVSFILMFIPGFIIAQTYWYPIMRNAILGKTSSAALHLTMSMVGEYNPILSLIKTIFFNFCGTVGGILTILVLLSIVFLYILKKYNSRIEYLLLILVGVFFTHISLMILSKIFTIEVNTVLMRMTGHFWGPLIITLLSLFSILMLFKYLKKSNKLVFRSSVVIIIILFFLAHYFAYFSVIEDNIWNDAGKRPLSPHLDEISEYIIENTDVSDVILTNKELAFSINALTGRKFVANPAGQKSLLYDFNSRERDLAIMLYGNGSAPREELFDKYNVEYFYWDPYWIQSEFRFNRQGQVVGLFDPIELFNTPENKIALSKYNIPYTEEHIELSPNKRGKAPKYDVLLVYPNFNMTHPWDSSLDKYLNLQKRVQYGSNIAEFYKVNY